MLRGIVEDINNCGCDAEYCKTQEEVRLAEEEADPARTFMERIGREIEERRNQAEDPVSVTVILVIYPNLMIDIYCCPVGEFFSQPCEST